MNIYENFFFTRYFPKGDILKALIHKHWIYLVGTIIFNLFILAFIPSFIFAISERLQSIIDFKYLEVYLFLIYFKTIYDILNWYNDVFLITNNGIIYLKWALFKTDVISLGYDNIEGIEIGQDSFFDKILNKGDIIIHKLGNDNFKIENAIISYDIIDEIQNMIHNKNTSNNSSEKEDNFDLIIDSLNGVVKDYLYTKDKNIYTKSKQNEILIEKIKDNKGTIDLRINKN